MNRWNGHDTAPQIVALLQDLAPIKDGIAHHEVFNRLDQLEGVQRFMEHHVFAVFDFMSLLSGLRNTVNGVSLPWMPQGTPDTRRFINELVLAEDSDEHPHKGGFTSHFELYLEAMEQAGASTVAIRSFLDDLRSGLSVIDALAHASAPRGSVAFVTSTWSVIERNDPVSLIGAFAFGRESLIPDMFAPLATLASREPRLELFCSYLDRHIELDGDAHTPLAFRLVSEICGSDPVAWARMAATATESLLARRSLWDAVAEASPAPLMAASPA